MAEASNPKPQEVPEAENLPKLSASDFHKYNQMAEMMQSYHNHFRQTWTAMHNACSTGKRPSNMTLKQFLAYCMTFCRQLTMHHNIEEEYIFPDLGRKMPIFQDTQLMKEQHKGIHAGLDRFEHYLNQCREGEREYRASELKEIMDSFGDVLWAHLDAEVEQLGAENMRKYWTLQEMNGMRY
ncbi:hypothetical protein BT63DRAFT_411532 [Microthyrium microscopicum]|uniref:Hemerythrin-like domain-containing protein n=1 Tax=Microthyrium microscopicum TaxID=703497 RepID=A0A6A6ULB6_9PEZI|nr:hypothetical protein BT63DRAFT_411532 [Microthyrium microscopicum]